MISEERGLLGLRGVLGVLGTLVLGGGVTEVVYLLVGRAAGAVPSTGLIGDVFPVVVNAVLGAVVGVFAAGGFLTVAAIMLRRAARTSQLVLGGSVASAVVATAAIAATSGVRNWLLIAGSAGVYLILAAIGRRLLACCERAVVLLLPLLSEYVHSRQWAASGEVGFLGGYAAAGVWAGFRWSTDWVSGGHGDCLNAGCYHIYEDAAGLKEGFYSK